MADEQPTNAKHNAGFHLGRFLRNLAIVVALIGAGIWVWDQYVKDQVIIRNYGVVTDGEIYRAGRQSNRTMRKLHNQHDIKTIVDLGAFVRGSERENQMEGIADELGIERHRFDLEGDATGNPNDYVAALRLMADESNYPMLVQCGAGAQRTTLAVLLYRRIVEGKSFEEAYPEAFKHEHDPEDDWILLTYLAEHYDEIRTAFENETWIEGYPLPRDYWVGGPEADRAAAERDDDAAPVSDDGA